MMPSLGVLSLEEITALESLPSCQRWPWEIDPYRLWSLEEMLRQVNVARIVSLLRLIQTTKDAMGVRPDLVGMQHLYSQVTEMRKECASLPFPPSIDRLFDDLLRNQTVDSSIANAKIVTIQNEIQSELGAQCFLVVKPEYTDRYNCGSACFGDKVESAFPDACQDIGFAGKCFALEQPTACVFHLMRVLESGLRILAAQLKLNSITDLYREQWFKIISECKKQTDRLPKEDRDHYQGALAYLDSAKNAWRNHNAHARVTYNDQEASDIWNSVNSFMRRLAEKV